MPPSKSQGSRSNVSAEDTDSVLAEVYWLVLSAARRNSVDAGGAGNVEPAAAPAAATPEPLPDDSWKGRLTCHPRTEPRNEDQH